MYVDSAQRINYNFIGKHAAVQWIFVLPDVQNGRWKVVINETRWYQIYFYFDILILSWKPVSMLAFAMQIWWCYWTSNINDTFEQQSWQIISMLLIHWLSGSLQIQSVRLEIGADKI